MCDNIRHSGETARIRHRGRLLALIGGAGGRAPRLPGLPEPVPPPPCVSPPPLSVPPLHLAASPLPLSAFPPVPSALPLLPSALPPLPSESLLRPSACPSQRPASGTARTARRGRTAFRSAKRRCQEAPWLRRKREPALSVRRSS